MGNRIARVILGMFLGFVAQVIGFVLYWLWFTRNNSWDLKYFYEFIFKKMNNYQIGTFSILAAMILFYFVNKKQLAFIARGVVISIVMCVVYLIGMMSNFF